MSTDPNQAAQRYRPGVGLCVFNSCGKIFVGKRLNSEPAIWQFPQGGLDQHETPSAAALRELREETGIQQVKIVANLAARLRYKLPPSYRTRFLSQGYVGQELTWFLCHFFGNHQQIKLDCHQPEFSAWQWISPDHFFELPLADYKVANYRSLLQVFAPKIKQLVKEMQSAKIS